MMTPDELKEKYPNSSYPPDPNCHRCHGTGIVTKAMKDGHEAEFPCPCLFFHPEYREKVVKMLSEFAHGELAKMGKR